MIVVCCYGVILVGYVFFIVLVFFLVLENKGVVMFVLNLGSGFFVFVGFLIVIVFIGFLGMSGVIWIFVCLYFFGVFLIGFFMILIEIIIKGEIINEVKSLVFL